MPELSRFAGIIIRMIYKDNKQHNKPHIHAYYGEYEASIGIDGELLGGSLPAKQYNCSRLARPTRGRSLRGVE